MALFDWFRKKKEPNHMLDDTDRELSLTTRRQSAQLKQARAQLELERLKMEHALEMERMQAELEELREDDEEEEESDNTNDALLAGMFAKIMFGQQQQAVQVNANIPTKRAYSNEEISLLLEKIPKGARKQVAKMSDEDLIQYSNKFASDADDGSVMRAINIIRSWR